MAQRFSDTMKWDDDWFLELPPLMKCVWEYLRDNCDGGTGIMKISFRKMSRDIGAEIERSDLDRHFAERVHWINRETLWIHGFLKAQFKKMSPENKAHIHMAKKVATAVETGPKPSGKARSSLDALLLIIRPSTEGLPTLKEKDKDTGKVLGGCGGKFKNQYHDDAVAVAAQLKKHGNWSKHANEIQAALGLSLYAHALKAGPHRMRNLKDDPFYLKNIADLLADAAFQMQLTNQQFAKVSTQLEEFA